MYHPCSGPAFSAAGGERWNVFALPQEQFPIHHSWGFGNGSQVRRIVTQSLRVPCEWMQRWMDPAGILTLRAEKAVLCPHPVFSSTSLPKMQQHIWLRFTKSRVTLRSIFRWSVAHVLPTCRGPRIATAGNCSSRRDTGGCIGRGMITLQLCYGFINAMKGAAWLPVRKPWVSGFR
jgi:hypothetical protein